MHYDRAGKMVLGLLCLVVLGMNYPVTCSNCFDMDSSLKQESAMMGYIFDYMHPSNIYGCSSECLRSSTCKSFNFHLVTRTCQLNSNISDHTNVVSLQHYVFSDIDQWPATLSGPCAELQCQPGHRCRVNRLDRPACHQEFPGCGSPPPLIPNSEMEYDGHYIGAEAKYTCADDFLPCHKNTTRVCQPSTGRWEEMTDLCGRFRFQNEGNVNFPCGQTSHFTATIKGMMTGERMEISVRSDGSATFHVQFRVNENSVSYNTLFGSWSTALNVSHMTLTPNTEFNIKVQLKEGVYTMEVDGVAFPPFPEEQANRQPHLMYIRSDVHVDTVVVQV